MSGMLITFRELCDFLKAEEAVVLTLLESGSLPPPLNIGDRLIRWFESDLVKWVQMGCPKFPPPTPEELALIRASRLDDDSPPANADAIGEDADKADPR